MKVIGDLGLGRDFNASKSAEKISGIFPLVRVNGRTVLPVSSQSLRFAGAIIVPFDFNSQFWSYLTTGNLLENYFNIYVLCVKH